MRSPSLLTLICFVLLTGCTSRQQKQDAADAVAGVEAMEITASPTLPDNVKPAFGMLAAGVKSFIAAVAQIKLAELPPPTKAPEEVAVDPQQYMHDAQQAEKDAAAGFWAAIGGGALLLLAAVRKFGPLLGPVGASVSSAIGMLGQLWKPRQFKEAEARAQVADKALWRVVEQIESFNPDDPVIKELKKAISRNTPAEFHRLFKEWRDAHTAEG